jgi:hypothetical protein
MNQEDNKMKNLLLSAAIGDIAEALLLTDSKEY